MHNYKEGKGLNVSWVLQSLVKQVLNLLFQGSQESALQSLVLNLLF